MRTHLDLSQEVHATIKDMAANPHMTMGQVASGLVRHALKKLKKLDVDGRYKMARTRKDILRTTLNLDSDIRAVIMDLAKSQRTTAGQVVSGLAYHALNELKQQPSNKDNEYSLMLYNGSNKLDTKAQIPYGEKRHGFKPFPSRGVVVTNELINEIREEIGY